mmetsp:Transcript_75381/g.126832  ORF Transcript_75381/g.126832 Transcript_75381/m.126832 type:complete len:206 (-) Transcript_75381:30-647(-)
MEASALLSAMPACAVRSAPQSLPPSPHIPVTMPRCMWYSTHFTLSSGCIRANTLVCSSRGPWAPASGHSGLMTSSPRRRKAAPVMTTSVPASKADLPSETDIGLGNAPTMTCEYVIVFWSAATSSSRTRSHASLNIPTLCPMVSPVSTWSPVIITGRTSPDFKHRIASAASGFGSFLNSMSPKRHKSDSNCGRCRSLMLRLSKLL